MVDALVRTSVFHVGLGVGGTTIASASRVRTSHSWTSRLLTSSFSSGVSSLFCRGTQCMYVRYVDSSTLDFSLSSHRLSFISLLFSSRFLDS
jgi:hypothetical protein